MEELDEQQERGEELGPLLRRLRGGLSLREVNRLTGVSSSYLSKIERGERPPGANLLRKLAFAYNVDAEDLIRQAGHLGQSGLHSDEALEVERALPVRAVRPRLPGGHPARRSPVPERQAVHRGDVRALHQQDAAGVMTVTLDDFCHRLLDDELFRERLEPERLAAAFTEFFHLSARPTVVELAALLRDAGFGTVSGRELDGLKGVHFGAPRGEYDIYYREDLWDGAKAHTVLHEAYEIIHETLWAFHSDDLPERRVCREADRFAAAVLMPRDTFTAYALVSGLDVVVLQRVFQCSYASVAMRLAEVMRRQPLVALLYERQDKGGPGRLARPGQSGVIQGRGGETDGGLWFTGFPPVLRLAERRSPSRQVLAPPAPWPSRRSGAEGRSTPRRTVSP